MSPPASVIRPSLRRRLVSMLGGATLLAALVAGAVSFVLAYVEAREFQDDTLRQIARLAGRGRGVPAGGGAGGRSVRAASTLDDPESLISVIRLPDDPRPAWLTGTLAVPGFHTLDTQAGRLRVFLLKESAGRAVVVTQPTDSRDELAINSALRALIPLLLLLPLMVWLIARLVRSGLSPVTELAMHLDAQAAGQPQPLPERDLPEEMAPFVQAINRLLARISGLLGQQRRFVADAAHELRTPLAALSIQAQNLGRAKSREEMAERLGPLLDGIGRARKLAGQLLSLARLQAGEAALTPVEVNPLARELLAELMPLAEAKNIDLGLDETAVIGLDATPDGLRLMIVNGLENAIKYTPAGGEVTLRLRVEEDQAVIEVIDNGPGIPDEERERVFAPFHRRPGAGGEGSGLGLTIAREAAASFGGELSLRTRPDGAGTVFCYHQARRREGRDAGG